MVTVLQLTGAIFQDHNFLVCKTGIKAISALQLSKMNRINLKTTLIIGRGSPRSEARNSKQNPQNTLITQHLPI